MYTQMDRALLDLLHSAAHAQDNIHLWKMAWQFVKKYKCMRPLTPEYNIIYMNGLMSSFILVLLCWHAHKETLVLLCIHMYVAPLILALVSVSIAIFMWLKKEIHISGPYMQPVMNSPELYVNFACSHHHHSSLYSNCLFCWDMHAWRRSHLLYIHSYK